MKFSGKQSFINGISMVGNSDSTFDYIVPGFIDIHCHGGGGHYFADDAVQAINTHRNSGTRIQIASLVTEDLSKLVSQIEYLKKEDVFGIHLEGPYLSEKFKGVHNPKFLRTPAISEIKELVAVGEGAIKMITIAPELNGAIEAIDFLVKKNITVAIGHSDAKENDVQNAISAGATLVTHINNGMSKLGLKNSLAEIVLDSDLYLELIQDGVHVSKSDSFGIIAKAPNRIVAVTDAMSAAGCKDGDYQIGNFPVTVRNQIARLENTDTLAGSTLTMLDSFLNYLNLVGFEKAVEYTSLNPAKILNVDPYEGYIGIKVRKVTFL